MRGRRKKRSRRKVEEKSTATEKGRGKVEEKVEEKSTQQVVLLACYPGSSRVPSLVLATTLTGGD